jgi:hypothetical protein
VLRQGCGVGGVWVGAPSPPAHASAHPPRQGERRWPPTARCYDRLFRDLDLRGVDDARSVFSPAAYLADLLQLLHDRSEDPDLVQRRPTIEGVPLDAERTYTVLPYLDIVNEVLVASLGADAFHTLTTLRHPPPCPSCCNTSA